MNNGIPRIWRFTVFTDPWKAFNPFALWDADRIYYFRVQFTAHAPRLDAITPAAATPARPRWKCTAPHTSDAIGLKRLSHTQMFAEKEPGR